MRYRRIPEEVDAEQWFSIHQPPPTVLDVEYSHHAGRWFGRLSDNGRLVYVGEWVIVGENGEQWACDHDTFEATFERVEGSEGPELG